MIEERSLLMKHIRPVMINRAGLSRTLAAIDETVDVK